MYLFTRVRTARAARLGDAIAYAREVRDFINDRAEVNVSLHTNLFGRPVGTLTWAGLTEGRGQVADVQTGLMADRDFVAMVERSGEMFEDNGRDVLRHFVEMHGLGPDREPPACSQAWSGQVANGQYDHAMGWAIDMADYVTGVTGVEIATLTDSYGPFGTITWIAPLDSAQHADTLNEQLAADAEWVKRLNYSEDLFIPGSGHVWLNRRID
jgi:hypothetical protein